MTPTIRLALGSLAVGFAVLGLKTLAWALTGSVALLSDALESIVNVAAAVVALIAVRVAAHPADRRHPYGHDKAEFLSAVVEGAMIIVAAFLILHEAWSAWAAPRMLDAPLAGLLANAAASALNGAWCWVLIVRGRALRSPALVADGKHLLADVVSSVGVLAGVALAVATGWTWLDPALAALVAVNVLWSGWKVVTQSVSGLMDEALSDEALAAIRSIIASEGGGALEAHDLRTRHAGSATFMDFHLVVPGAMTVARAHAICDRIEAALKQKFPDAKVTIHLEPEHEAQRDGALQL